MERTEILSLFKNTPADGTEITVCGWAKNIRDSKNIGFIALSDGGCFKTLQVVLEAGKLANYDEVIHTGLYSSLRIKGKLVLTPQAKQPFELNAESVEILGDCPADEYPLQKKKMSMEYLRTMPTLRPRTNTFNAAFRVRSVAAYAIHKFFQENGFVYAHSPLITASDCEGAGEMFRVTTLDLDNLPKTEDGAVDYSKDFFEKPVNLTVSGQLEAEAMAMAFGKVYTFGPTFRAEKSFTTRHAAEFWMIEPEMAFCDLNGYMDNAEAMIKYVIRYVLDNCPDEMAFFNQFIDKGLVERLELVANSEFARISYTEAIEILKKNNKKFQYPVEWGVDIQTEHERYLTEVVYKKPVFVTDYPKEIKSFYMKQNADGKTVAAADMLVPGIGELIGVSPREEDNRTGHTVYLKDRAIPDGEMVTFSVWAVSGLSGLLFDLEPCYIANYGRYTGRLSLSTNIGEEQLKVIEDYMEQHDKWTVDKNCSYWSVHLWNAVVGEDAALKIRGFVCTPEKIEQAFSAFDGVEVDKDFSRAGGIYCYKDGERTELQLCS